MQLKPGVRIIGVRPELLVGIWIADEVWKRQGNELVVTSVIDGTHTRASEHYSGCAADFRVRGLADPERAAQELRLALGSDFDVIHENVGTENAHIHLEYQPKLGY